MTSSEPLATSALEPLAPLVGRWASEGETIASTGEPAIRIVGTDVYSWLGGGHFIEHRVHVRMGDDVVEVLEVIGDPHDNSYAMHSFDQTGSVGLMRATVDDAGVMHFTGDAMRTSLTVADDRQSMQATWERRGTDDRWEHWMDMRFTRI